MFMRLFIALNLPEKIRELLYKTAKELKEKGLFQGKITEKENLHLTLKFLGDIREEKIDDIIKRLDEIKINKAPVIIGNFGVFDEKFVRIIWVKLAGADELQKEIDSELLDIFNKDQEFSAHLTLGRVKLIKDKEGFKKNIKFDITNKEFIINEFCLVKSTLSKDGPKYEILERFKLE